MLKRVQFRLKANSHPRKRLTLARMSNQTQTIHLTDRDVSKVGIKKSWRSRYAYFWELVDWDALLLWVWLDLEWGN